MSRKVYYDPDEEARQWSQISSAPMSIDAANDAAMDWAEAATLRTKYGSRLAAFYALQQKRQKKAAREADAERERSYRSAVRQINHQGEKTPKVVKFLSRIFYG